MGRVWLEAATLAHIERAVLLIKTRNDLEKKNPRRKALRAEERKSVRRGDPGRW